MRYVFILLIFCKLSFAVETPVSKIVSGKPLLEKNPAARLAQSPPNPMELKADWWRYFEVAPNALKERIDKTSGQLKRISQTLPENLKPDVNPQIDRIIENLRALLELRNNDGPEIPPSLPQQKTYTLKQWLDIIHKQRTLQAELQSENEDMLRSERRFNAKRNRLDSMTAAYLALQDKSQDKIAQGVGLMAAWSEMALNGERFRLKKMALNVQRTQLERLIEEGVSAQARLSVNRNDLQRLAREIEAAERELDSAREQASQLAATSMTGNLETDEGKARSLLFEQRLRHATVKEAIGDTVVTRKKIERELVRMMIEPDNKHLDKLRKQLRDNLDHIAEINGRLDIWREETESDQGRAGKSLAALLGSAVSESGELIALNQQRLSEAQNTLLSLQRLDSEIYDTRLFADRVLELISEKEGVLKNWLETVKTTGVKVWDMVWYRLETSLFKIGETPVTMLGILRVVLIITLAWIFSHTVRRGLSHLGERQHGSSAFLYTLGRLAHYLILIIGISIGLSSIGVDLSNFALIAGALSLGVGFGLQAIVSNFVSGLILLFERSLRIGDFVELSSGEAGEVRAVNVRSTLVTTADMVDILVPNSEFVNGKVINWTLTDASRRIHIHFGVAYGSDKELVRKAALEAAERTPYTLKDRRGREPEVWLINFGDSSLDFDLVVWVLPHAVKKPQRVRAAYYWELETALHKYGIQIPFPQRDLHIRSGLPKMRTFIEEESPPSTQ